MLHYNPLVLDIDAAKAEYKNTAPYSCDSVYSLEEAIKFGFLPELQRKRKFSRNEAIRILTQAKLQCSISPISCTPIRVSCRGDVVEQVRSILPDPMFHDWSIDPNGVEMVDVWDWGLTDL